MMYCVYILENQNESIYIGSTDNLEKRLENHNDPTRVGWTRKRGPWKLIYKEDYETRSEAMRREKFLKSLKAGQRIKKILGIDEK